MPNLLKSCQEFFFTDNLYNVLGVSKEATTKEIKKGYHKKSLAFHPDRVSNDSKLIATKKFQVLSQVYSILSDEACRAAYNETGIIDEESVDEERDWEQYWRLLFPKITSKDIQEFAEKYRGSEEEKEDLKNVYLTSEGDMNTVMNTMMCSTFQDEGRYAQILNQLIEDGKVPNYDAFSKESKKKKNLRIKKALSEAKEAEQEAKKLKLDDSEDSLIAAIRQSSRARQAENFLQHLEDKYSDGGSAAKPRKGVRKSKR
ncbi:unnamed protein product [Lymnaea stagnalis]|uniref:J domain-containing protein n=1 Tax=Lymnaea stagnalis TaxID=6523 RepID=A0AAV2HDN8_LYMST